jgi:GT2 family glycosyltransferase
MTNTLIIVPTLGKGPLDRCLRLLEQYTEGSYTILVVADNASSETKKIIDNHNCDSIINPKRIGLTKALNQGFSRDAEFYSVVLDDVLVTPNWLSKLKQGFGVHPQIGIVVPVCNYGGHDLQECIHADGDISDDKLLEINQMVEKLHKRMLIIHAPVWFTCPLISRGTIEKVGYLDEKLFAHHADLDYCYRMTRENIASAIVIDTYAHNIGRTTLKGSAEDKMYNRDTKRFNKKWQGNIRLR